MAPLCVSSPTLDKTTACSTNRLARQPKFPALNKQLTNPQKRAAPPKYTFESPTLRLAFGARHQGRACALGGGSKDQVYAAGALVQEQPVQESVQEGWWTRETADNMKDICSLRELTSELETGRDKLVIVDFYAQWCNSCRALYPKLCKIARENPNIIFLKVNWKDNKVLCKSLGIRALPFFHFYRGAEGRVEAFTASITKIKRLKDAINLHSTPRCSLGPSVTTKELFGSHTYEPSTAILASDGSGKGAPSNTNSATSLTGVSA